jgi:hypothetical protein
LSFRYGGIIPENLIWFLFDFSILVQTKASLNVDGAPGVSDSPHVVCFGELLIDFVPTVSGVSLAEAPAFKKAPGGAPANVAVGIARLGGSSAFIGKVTYLSLFWSLVLIKQSMSQTYVNALCITKLTNYGPCNSFYHLTSIAHILTMSLTIKHFSFIKNAFIYIPDNYLMSISFMFTTKACFFCYVLFIFSEFQS